MAENISDVNTEDEEKMKETRHERAVVKKWTSEEESSFSDVDSVLIPLPDPKEFCGSQNPSNKPIRILASYENSIISKTDELAVLNTEK
jgi:hypothetical protein